MSTRITCIIFYALKVRYLPDICESPEITVLRRAWTQEPTQEQIDTTVQQWVVNMAKACDESRSLYKVKQILSVRVIDFIVEV